jgi:excisionase family DNA binding protein
MAESVIELKTPYTPETLADRWRCSASHVRKMIGRGELPAFRLGGRLLRVRARVVEEFERCGDLDDIETSGQQSPEPDRAESVVRLARLSGR